MDIESAKSKEGSGYTLEVKDLSYTVNIKKNKEMVSKTIIHPTNFTIIPKKMLAIMGSSGAGKSTLIDILATKIPLDNTEGEYLLNDKPLPKSFRRISGYVMQSDALYPLLTVYETLMYAAQLRVHNKTLQEKKLMVEETIKVLRLESCAKTIIGDELRRGVSGGEKRRVSIGVDIIHQPSIIFLDEPTSGLDSTTALQIVETLNELCLKNRTVCVTIHQPSSRILETFSRVIFMSKGHVVYNGSIENLENYVSSISKADLPHHANLSEIFLEVISGYEQSGDIASLVDKKNENEKHRQDSATSLQAHNHFIEEISYANSIFKETLIILNRNAVNFLRTPELFFIRLTLSVVVALVMGSLYWNINLNNQDGRLQLLGYASYVVAFYLFTSLEVLPIFLKERDVFIRENSRGAYRISSFVLANFLVNVPFIILISIVFIGISFFMLQLQNANGNFIYTILICFCIMLAGNSFATFVSGVVPDALTGNSAGTALLAFMFLFGGFFIRTDDIPDGWIWFNYISMFRYPVEGILRSNFEMLDNGESYYDEFNIEDVERWSIIGIMWVFIVGFRVLFFVTLKLKYGSKH